MRNRTVLISGASIAGPALAYWLNRYGFSVTVVEKADALRGGGYPIDIRGTAVEVVRRMGILPQLQRAHIDSRRITFLDADGHEVAAVDPNAVAGSAEGHNLEVRRGDLAESLYALVRDDIEFRFADSVVSSEDSGRGVDVTFRSGHQQSFDLVVGADGMHSETRKRLFGDEKQFHHDLGHAFAVFTAPNTFGLSHEVMMWNTPGRAAALYAVEDRELHVLLTAHLPAPQRRDADVHKKMLFDLFADAKWEIPGLLDVMGTADDLFLDRVAQIRMPRWSEGRVGLVGDSAYAPSFFTGQGASLALAGAYLLAHSLASGSDPVSAFDAYEHGLRGFVTANHGLVDHGTTRLFPTTPVALEQRNALLRSLTARTAPTPRPAYSALTLPPLTA